MAAFSRHDSITFRNLCLKSIKKVSLKLTEVRKFKAGTECLIAQGEGWTANLVRMQNHKSKEYRFDDKACLFCQITGPNCYRAWCGSEFPLFSFWQYRASSRDGAFAIDSVLHLFHNWQNEQTKWMTCISLLLIIYPSMLYNLQSEIYSHRYSLPVQQPCCGNTPAAAVPAAARAIPWGRTAPRPITVPCLTTYVQGLDSWGGGGECSMWWERTKAFCTCRKGQETYMLQMLPFCVGSSSTSHRNQGGGALDRSAKGRSRASKQLKYGDRWPTE